MKYLYNCDDLVAFTRDELINYPYSVVWLCGELIEVCRTDRQYPVCTVGDIFVSDGDINGYFFLQNVNTEYPMMTPTIMVPNYQKEELIATLKGEIRYFPELVLY